MSSLWHTLTSLHLIGLVVGLGAATVKIGLIVAVRNDSTLIPAYWKLSKYITRFIVGGLAILTASGIGMLLLGVALTPLLFAKLSTVAIVWGIGPFIDKVVEPRLLTLMPAAGTRLTPAFHAMQKQYLAVEATALMLFYLAAVMGRMV